MAARRGNRLPDPKVLSPCGDRELKAPCLCRAAVTRAYYEMLLSGASPVAAKEVAVRVYNYHHPGYAPAEAGRLIERWLIPNALH